ncbi:serine hydrolase domain-containing protein [Sinosporangium siamense]|uniref:Serine hydrolase n=1 Tax=Sinosporangium siamense TaxID=1367973 RepID=A0A919RAI7_9ACTN|nr:serine hydrolase domain-containing protein [Sinosporangium siamense]GII90396.1 serine hydrolase [Sinosporangium siamense]
MTRESSPPRASRRSMLGLLGAAPVAAGLVAAGRPTRAEASASRPAPGELRPGGEFDRFLADRAAKDLFSGVVVLAYRGRPVFRRAYGMANKADSIPNRLQTRFDLASVTKTFTAVAVAQLAERGKIGFHEKLGTYLQGFSPEIGQNVTVHQLLTHTAGVGRPPMGSEPPTRPEWDTVQKVWDGTAKTIRGLPPQFTPGTQYRYSNDGYFLLGEIVATVSGQSYYDYVREHIFKPAGMTHADFSTKPQVIADRDIARPYASRPSGERFDFTTSPVFPFVGLPYRGAYATAGDLLAFAHALRNGKLLGSAYAELITGGKTAVPPTEQPAITRQHMFYGYGFSDAIVNGRHVVGHSGGGPGAGNNLDVFPGLDWVAVILGNYDAPAVPIVELERRLVVGNAR